MSMLTPSRSRIAPTHAGSSMAPFNSSTTHPASISSRYPSNSSPSPFSTAGQKRIHVTSASTSASASDHTGSLKTSTPTASGGASDVPPEGAISGGGGGGGAGAGSIEGIQGPHGRQPAPGSGQKQDGYGDVERWHPASSGGSGAGGVGDGAGGMEKREKGDAGGVTGGIGVRGGLGGVPVEKSKLD